MRFVRVRRVSRGWASISFCWGLLPIFELSSFVVEIAWTDAASEGELGFSISLANAAFFHLVFFNTIE